jgi:hypothetical protein
MWDADGQEFFSGRMATMNLRNPVRAGSFYEASPASCRRQAQELIAKAQLPSDMTGRIFGGIVPHAGWAYSGRLAAKTLKALSGLGGVETVVLLGAIHYGATRLGGIYDNGAWHTPVGDVNIDEELAAEIIASGYNIEADLQAHAYEHSIEVQVPLLKALYPDAKIVPIAVPPVSEAVKVGEQVGKAVAKRFPAVRVIGSTDLTHHGGHFASPGGKGQAGVKWAVANDRRMIDLMESMEADKIVPEADANGNACGAGAIAATVAACRTMGAVRGICLEYTNSYDVAHAMFPHDPDDTTVGYASVVFV